MKCTNVSENSSKCFRSRVNGTEFCEIHQRPSSGCTRYLNDDCPICMDEGDLYPLPCFHRAHLECLSGMTKLECPLCRAKLLNLPALIRKKIEKNGEQYKEEVHEEERREIRDLLEREGGITQRLPPQVELILAMKYVFELGIPLELIPVNTIIEIDAESPLPEPGSIFQNAVKKILELIQNNVIMIEGEDDEYLTDESSFSDEDSIFELEGGNIQITHQIRTVPSPNNSNEIALRIPAMFTTINFNLRNLDAIGDMTGDFI